MDGSGLVQASTTSEEPPQESDATRWYAVFTHPHSEELAARHLAYQGFKTYLPLRLKTVRHARRFVTKRSAYFGRYLFVSLVVERQRWRAINATIGVNNLVMNDARPVPIRRGVVDSLISATDDAGILRPSTLAPGQKVRVTAGAFQGQLGVLDYVDEAGAVRILLEIMCRHVPVRLCRDQIVVLPLRNRLLLIDNG